MNPAAQLFRHLPFPCPGCGSDEAPPGGRSFCPECRKKLRLFPEKMAVCPGCGGPLNSALAVCSQCLIEPERSWRSAAAAFPYSGFGRQLVRRFKFADCPELAGPLGVLMADAARFRRLTADVLVPVPLNWRRLWFRGYNQAALLAKIAGGELGLPVVSALRRVGRRPKQATLGRRERHFLRGLFRCPRPELIRGRRVMLVDDVFTTGATLGAVGKVLLEAGALEVTVLVAARTPAYSALDG
ncbi:MAG: ComF family protein [Lentisphaeria bacterium]|nr:ComF family protein [Lentisphaeria bacterium]